MTFIHIEFELIQILKNPDKIIKNELGGLVQIVDPDKEN